MRDYQDWARNASCMCADCTGNPLKGWQEQLLRCILTRRSPALQSAHAIRPALQSALLCMKSHHTVPNSFGQTHEASRFECSLHLVVLLLSEHVGFFSILVAFAALEYALRDELVELGLPLLQLLPRNSSHRRPDSR